MTIQTKIHDGISVKTRTYRGIINLVSHREGFMSQAEYSKWGVMTQLKGNERIKLATFGKVGA